MSIPNGLIAFNYYYLLIMNILYKYYIIQKLLYATSYKVSF